MKKRLKWIRPFSKVCIALVAFLVLIPVLVSLFFPRCFCFERQVNIRTGHTRTVFNYYFFRYPYNTERTWITGLVFWQPVERTDGSNWHVTTSSIYPNGPSANYAFHSAIYQINELDSLCQEYDLSDKERKQLAMSLLASWQLTGNDNESYDWLLRINLELHEKKLKENTRRHAQKPVNESE